MLITMLGKKLMLLLLCISPSVIDCWKPIGPPTTFSVHHPHFASESLKPNNELLQQDSSAENTITTYHGNQAFSIPSGDHVSFLPEDHVEHVVDHSEHLGLGSSEGRIVNGKSLYFAQEFEQNNGLYKDNSCSAAKFAFNHEGTVNYNQQIPKLDQFSICLWMRFTKHDGDHVMFTYSAGEEEREIQFWVANTNNSSFISMALHGQSLYRLNYPFLMRKWHHACTSWNGKTGEWQLWVKAERVGRGFHNRLVGYNIKPDGKTFSGGPSITGPIAEDLHFEVTLLQMYKVALSAGKAHRDHKHHHVHHFDHNGPIVATTAAPTPPPPPAAPANPNLANGQIPTRVRINFAGPQPAPAAQGVPSQIVAGALNQGPIGTVNTQFVSGQFHTGNRILQEQLLAGNIIHQSQRNAVPRKFTFPSPSASASSQISNASPESYSSFISFGEDNQPHNIFKREQKKEVALADDKKVTKRDLVMLTDGSVVDDKYFDNEWYDGLAQFGGNDLKKSLTRRDSLEEEIKEHDREPAEGEVEAVKSYCSKCQIEPFQSALIFAWKDIQVTLDHALQAKSSDVCGEF